MPWTRLDHKQLKNVGGHDDSPYLRAYGPDGNVWPRIILDIMDYSPYGPGFFKITCSRKDDEDSWWGESEIPLELAKDVLEIVEQYASDHAAQGKGGK